RLNFVELCVIDFRVEERRLDGLGLIIVPIIVGFDPNQGGLRFMPRGEGAGAGGQSGDNRGGGCRGGDPFAAIAMGVLLMPMAMMAGVVLNFLLDVFSRIMAHDFASGGLIKSHSKTAKHTDQTEIRRARRARAPQEEHLFYFFRVIERTGFALV